MAKSAEHAARPFLASAYVDLCVNTLWQTGHTSLWLAKTYVIPAGMYGSQVWGTGFLQAGREFSSPLSTLHLHSLKGTLGVKQSTTDWALLQECGHEPLQFFWFRSAVKLFNRMLTNTNSDTLRRVVQADLNLQPRSSACWTAQLLSACHLALLSAFHYSLRLPGRFISDQMIGRQRSVYPWNHAS